METLESLRERAGTEDIKKDMLTYVAAKNVKKVAICVPARGMVESSFLNNYITIFTFFMKQPGIIPLPIFSDKMPVDAARNELAKLAITHKCDYILFMDSDTYIGESSLQVMWDLLLREDVHAVTGIYYLREQPYTPVLRMNDGNGHMMPIPFYDKEKPFTVDGAGMGAFLMKRSALDAVYVSTKGRPFWFSEDCSEDLNFCKRLTALKDAKGNPFSIWCHPHATCGHYGAFVYEWHHLHHAAEQMTELGELFTYIKATENPAVTRKDIMARCYRAPYDIHNKFDKAFPGFARGAKYSSEEVDAFYRGIDDYLYDLTQYWFSRKKDIAEMFARIPKNSKRFLDFGCGIGDCGLTVMENFKDSHVVFHDINIPNLRYLRWRIDQRKQIFAELDASYVISASDKELDESWEGIGRMPFDVVFCLDVLEHMLEPGKGIAKIRSMLDRNGILLANIAPKSKLQSMHISTPDLAEHGFLQLGEFIYIRDDSDMAKNLMNLKV